MSKAATWRIMIAPVIIMLGITVFGCGAVGADTNPPSTAPKFDGQAPGEPQKIFRKITGVVKTIGSKDKTIAIQLSEGVQTYLVTSQTRFTRDGVPARMGDIVIGEAVDCTVVSIHGSPSSGA